MRILLATPELEGGGIASYTRSLAAELADLGHAVLVASPRTGGMDGLQTALSARLASLTAGGLAWRGRSWPLPGSWSVLALDAPPWQLPVGNRFVSNLGRAVPLARALSRAVRSLALPPDVVEGPEWDFPCGLVALENALPVVTRLHGHIRLVRWLNGEPLRAEDRIMCHLESLTLRRSTMRAANSAYLAQVSASDHRLDPASIAVLPLGVDVNRFAPGEQGSARDALGLPRGVPVVGFAGRLEVRKGLPLLIEAWRGLVRRHPTAILAIAGQATDGSDPLESPIAREIRSAIPPGRVKFLGGLPFDRMPAFYQAIDIFCAPFVGEPFGLVVLEAMASGRPVVALRSGGVAEIVEDAVHGFLTEPGHVEALEAALLRLIADDLLRLKMGEACRAQAIGAFSLRQMARRTVEAYEMARKLWQASLVPPCGHSARSWRWLSGRDRNQAAPEGPEIRDPDLRGAGRP